MKAECNEYVSALQLFISYAKGTVYSRFYHLKDCFLSTFKVNLNTWDASISAGNTKSDITLLAYYFTAFWRFCVLWFRKCWTSLTVWVAVTTTVCNAVSLRRWGVLVLVDDRQSAQGKIHRVVRCHGNFGVFLGLGWCIDARLGQWFHQQPVNGCTLYQVNVYFSIKCL